MKYLFKKTIIRGLGCGWPTLKISDKEQIAINYKILDNKEKYLNSGMVQRSKQARLSRDDGNVSEKLRNI